MKIVFAGTGNFAVPSLACLANLCEKTRRYQLVSVYTQPARFHGRGRSLLNLNPVKQCAVSYQLPIEQPQSLKEQASQSLLRRLAPDLIVVAAYGLILPTAVLKIPRLGCINVHGSLLPRWRGAAPVQRALLEGDEMTGITVMQMDRGLDTGAILYQLEEPILSDDTTASLEGRLAALGAQALRITIPSIESGQMTPYAQPKEGICYANKLVKEEGIIDWSLSAIQIHRQIRAFNPWPISFSWLNGERIRVWEAAVHRGDDKLQDAPGTVVGIVSDGIIVATGQGLLSLQRLQREGGRCLRVRDLLNGALSWLSVGMHFSSVG